MVKRNKRSILKSRRGDISTPLITVLIIIASVAIAAILIAWMYGVGLAASSQSQLVVIGTPLLKPESAAANAFMNLIITVRVAGNVPIVLKNATITVGTTTFYMRVGTGFPVYIDSTAITTADGLQANPLQPGALYTIKITRFSVLLLNQPNPNPLDKPDVLNYAAVFGTLETSAGSVNFAAQVVLSP